MDLDKPFFETMYADRGNVVDFMRAFAALRQRKGWREIGFEEDSLAWISRAWKMAAIAAAGNTYLREACIYEADRYADLRKCLVDGMMERREPGVVFLCDVSDWPHPQVLKQAIRALRHAQIGRIQ